MIKIKRLFVYEELMWPFTDRHCQYISTLKGNDIFRYIFCVRCNWDV